MDSKSGKEGGSEKKGETKGGKGKGENTFVFEDSGREGLEGEEVGVGGGIVWELEFSINHNNSFGA